MGVNKCGRGGAKLLYVRHAEDGEFGEGGIPLQQDPVLDVKPPVNEESDGVILYPNIASDEVNIAITPSNVSNMESPNKILGVRLYAQMQQVPKKGLNYQNPGVSMATMDVRDMSAGYYFVVIETDMGTITKTLLVK